MSRTSKSFFFGILCFARFVYLNILLFYIFLFYFRVRSSSVFEHAILFRLGRLIRFRTFLSYQFKAPKEFLWSHFQIDRLAKMYTQRTQSIDEKFKKEKKNNKRNKRLNSQVVRISAAPHECLQLFSCFIFSTYFILL